MAFFRVFLLCCLTSIALSKEGSPRDRDDDHHDGHIRRPMEVKIEKQEVEIKAKSREMDGEVKRGDKFEFKMKLESGGKMHTHLKYYTKQDDEGAKFGLRFKLHKLIEYTESADGVDGFEAGVDDIVSEFEDNKQWGDFDDLSDREGDPIVYKFQAFTEDDVLGVTGFVSEMETDVENEGESGNLRLKLDPDSAEILIDISNYPFQADDSRLAIIGKVATKQKMKEADGGILELEIEDNVFGNVMWSETISCDGEDFDVISSEQTEDTNDDGDDLKNFRIAFSFITDTQPTQCTWDPTVGLEFPGAGYMVNGFSVIAFGLFVALML